MNTEIITVQNVRGYIDETGTAWLNAGDIARGLGFTQTQIKDGKEYTSVRWERMNGYLAEFGFPQKVGENDYIPENMFYRLVWKSRDEKAIEFQAKVADEILPTLRKTGTYSLKPKAPTPVADMVSDVGSTADAIQATFAGVKRGIALAQAIDIVGTYKNFSLESLKQLLPPAEHQTGYLNASQVGEKLGLGKGTVAARRANIKLAEKTLQFKDGRNWRLTEDGAQYGEELPYSRNGHSDYQIRWNESVLEVLTEP